MKKNIHQNPYKRGVYFAIFAWIMTQIVKIGVIAHIRVTRQQVLDFCKSLGLNDTAATATTTVILGPTKESTRGDCRGNTSAMGHIYYMERIKPKGGGDMLYELHWRNPIMEAHRRAKVVKVKAVKAVKAPKSRKSRKSRKPIVKVEPTAPKSAEPTPQTPAAVPAEVTV